MAIGFAFKNAGKHAVLRQTKRPLSLKLRRFTDTSSWKRGNREAAVKDAMQGFADILAQECAQNPLQWFNFYDFWGEDAV